MQKYDFDEARPILERASARETAARVALGRVAQQLPRAGRRRAVVSHVIELGGVRAPDGLWSRRPTTSAPTRRRPGALPRPRRERARWSREIDQAHKDGDTLGGVVEVVVHGLPPGPRAPTSTGTAGSTPASPAR